MALFQAKIGWKMLRKIENKNYSSVTFLPTRNRKFEKKNSKIIQKIKKISLWFHFKPKQVGKT